jgi:hypothetical protein
MKTNLRFVLNAQRFVLCVLLCALTPIVVFSVPCATTPEEQAAWVQRSVDLLIRKARAAYNEERSERTYERTLNEISYRVRQCKLADDVSFVARYPEFLEYVRVLSLDQRPDHELGFEISDREYFDKTRTVVSIPDFLVTPEFLKAVRRYETLPQAKAILRSNNATRPPNKQLLFFSYESRHLGTPDNDNSYLRLLIVVPADSEHDIPEKWVQFGIPDPGARDAIRNLSVVAVAPGPEGTTNNYFKDYFRTYRRDGSVTIKGRWELGEGDDNCVKCHKSGVLPIFPVDGSVSENEKSIVEEVNRRFGNYSSPRFGGYLDGSKFGPGLGSARRTVDDRHPSTTSVNCAACHQPNNLGWLNWPMNSVLISSFVESGRMPMGRKLERWESSALYAQLIDDYFSIDTKRPGVLKAWLLGLDK